MPKFPKLNRPNISFPNISIFSSFVQSQNAKENPSDSTATTKATTQASQRHSIKPTRISTISSLVENTLNIDIKNDTDKDSVDDERKQQSKSSGYPPKNYDYKKDNYGLYAMKCDRNAVRRGLILNIPSRLSHKKTQSTSSTSEMVHEKYSPCKRVVNDCSSVESFIVHSSDDDVNEGCDKIGVSGSEKVSNKSIIDVIQQEETCTTIVVPPPRRKRRPPKPPPNVPPPPPPPLPLPVIVELHPKQLTINHTSPSSVVLDTSGEVDLVRNKSSLFSTINDENKNTNDCSKGCNKLNCRPQKMQSIDIFDKHGDAFEDFDDYFQTTTTTSTSVDGCRANDKLEHQSVDYGLCSKKSVKLNDEIVYINCTQEEKFQHANNTTSSMSLERNENVNEIQIYSENVNNNIPPHLAPSSASITIPSSISSDDENDHTVTQKISIQNMNKVKQQEKMMVMKKYSSISNLSKLNKNVNEDEKKTIDKVFYDEKFELKSSPTSSSDDEFSSDDYFSRSFAENKSPNTTFTNQIKRNLKPVKDTNDLVKEKKVINVAYSDVTKRTKNNNNDPQQQITKSQISNELILKSHPKRRNQYSDVNENHVLTKCDNGRLKWETHETRDSDLCELERVFRDKFNGLHGINNLERETRTRENLQDLNYCMTTKTNGLFFERKLRQISDEGKCLYTTGIIFFFSQKLFILLLTIHIVNVYVCWRVGLRFGNSFIFIWFVLVWCVIFL